jgi:hypothetical protein
MTTTRRPIFALRFIGWTVLFLAVLVNVDPSAKASVDRPDVVNAETLAATHDCGPAVQDPTHVIVTKAGTVRYAGQAMTDKAIEQAMFGIDHGLVVHTFCA